MPNYSFRETLGFFGEKLHAVAPEADLAKGEVELMVDTLSVVLEKGKVEGDLHMRVVLGLLLQPIREEKLKELATSNFLGIDTGGCKLSFDDDAVSLCLHCHTTSGTSPQESWEWMHRLLCIAREWMKVLVKWDEFVPLNVSAEVKKHVRPSKPSYKV